MRDRKVFQLYSGLACSVGMFLRSIFVMFSLFCGISFASAQSNVDEGLPPGWQQWAAQCGKTGHRDACYNEGVRHYWGADATPVDKEKAAHFFTIACKYNDINTCRQAIQITRDEIQNVSLYGKALDAGCLLGELVFCHEAYQFYSGYGEFETIAKIKVRAAFNPNLALAYANAACKKGSAFGCNRIGRAFSPDPRQTLKGIQADNTKSLDGFIQACRLDDIKGCYFAFHGSDGEEGFTVNTAVREEAMGLGCKLHIVGMCETEISTYLTGDKGSVKNRTKAISLMEEGCRRLKDEMCQAAGRAYLETSGASTINIEKGLKFMEKGCTHSNSDEKKERCGEAAYYLSLHLGEQDERTDHAAYFGCQANSAASCIIKGNNLRAEGKSKVYIRDTYQKACNLGHSDGCKWAKELNDDIAKSASKDPLEYYRKLCELNHKESCEYLEVYKKTMKQRAEAQKHNAAIAARAEKRRLTASSCPRASCERRSWSQYLKDERDAARARNNAWHKSGGYSSGYKSSYAPSGTPITPFGNSARSQRNWRIYNNNLRCGNPTASGC